MITDKGKNNGLILNKFKTLEVKINQVIELNYNHGNSITKTTK